MSDRRDSNVEELLAWCDRDKSSKWGETAFDKPWGPMGFYPRIAGHVRATDAALTASRERCKALEGALRELADAYEAMYPPAKDGHEAQVSWATRQSEAMRSARALLRQGEGQAGEART